MIMKQVWSIKHIGIYVRDLDKMVSFYKDVLGFIELTRYSDKGNHIDSILKRQGAEVEICKLVSPFGKEKKQGDMIELICFPENDRRMILGELFAPGMSHIGLEVEDVHKMYQTIQENGGQSVCEPIQVKESGNYLAFCRDVEGNYLELIGNK